MPEEENKREEFLEIMDEIIPRGEWVPLVAPYYPEGSGDVRTLG